MGTWREGNVHIGQPAQGPEQNLVGIAPDTPARVAVAELMQKHGDEQQNLHEQRRGCVATAQTPRYHSHGEKQKQQMNADGNPIPSANGKRPRQRLTHSPAPRFAQSCPKRSISCWRRLYPRKLYHPCYQNAMTENLLLCPVT
ncbi:hypothetical protein HRbin36_02455 [bacterium HR36]|nr:hypothetical protein HRbin36_02455 [bacterium HR36]